MTHEMALYIRVGDDNSLIIEFASKERRCGFVLARDVDDSGWYHVVKDGVMEGGELPDGFIKLLRDFFIKRGE